jgi:hypothetical protein
MIMDELHAGSLTPGLSVGTCCWANATDISSAKPTDETDNARMNIASSQAGPSSIHRGADPRKSDAPLVASATLTFGSHRPIRINVRRSRNCRRGIAGHDRGARLGEARIPDGYWPAINSKGKKYEEPLTVHCWDPDSLLPSMERHSETEICAE